MVESTIAQESFKLEISDFLDTCVQDNPAGHFRSSDKILIYGAGNIGSSINNILSDAGLNIVAFLDRSGKEGMLNSGKPVYKVRDYKQNSTCLGGHSVIISFIGNENQLAEVKQQLTKDGFQRVLTYYDIYKLLITNTLPVRNSASLRISGLRNTPFNEIKERVLKIAHFWQDDESRDVYRNYLKAIMQSDGTLYSSPSDFPQYFERNIPFKKGYERFIDCGAFDGDTAVTLKEQKGEIRALACFEPDIKNFKALQEALSQNRSAKEQFFIPCGVWGKSEMLRFHSSGCSTSNLSDSGDTYIQCVSIDEAIPDFSPTFIKMDVEGAEYEALLGAQQTLKQSRPDLAISVYHQIDHLWEIPLLVNELVPDYRYYLRSHGQQGLETIMYAVSE